MRKFTAGTAVAGLATAAAVVALTFTATAGDDDVCSNLSTGHLSANNQTTYTFTAPAGNLIVGYCVKAGSANQGDGPVYVTVDPPAASITFSHPTGKQISHFSVEYRPDQGTTTTQEETTSTTTTTGPTTTLGTTTTSDTSTTTSSTTPSTTPSSTTQPSTASSSTLPESSTSSSAPTTSTTSPTLSTTTSVAPTTTAAPTSTSAPSTQPPTSSTAVPVAQQLPMTR